MSRTDSTDPYWVKVARYGVIEHDHRGSVCTIDDGSRPIPATPGHHRRCPRWTRVERPCSTVTYCYARDMRNDEARARGAKPVDDCGWPHERWYYDHPEAVCLVCDAQSPSCVLVIPHHEQDGHRYWVTPPRWWRHHVTHGRNRTHGRARLGELVKAWNARDEHFDEDDWDVVAYTRSNANEYWD